MSGVATMWHLVQREQLQTSARELHEYVAGDRRHSVVATPSGVWVVSQCGQAARVAFRVAFSPWELGMESIEVSDDGSSVDVVMSSSIGAQTAAISFDASNDTVSAWTTLTPAEDLVMRDAPRDIVVDLDDIDGTVHTSQRGLRTGLVHAGLSAESGAFMYVQDLSLLGDYCDVTGASAKDTVSGEWPDLELELWAIMEDRR